MKLASNIATLAMTFGLAVWSGYLLFSAGSLVTIGYVFAIPLFAGSTAHCVISVINFLPKRDGKKADTPASEKEGIKPGATAQPA